MSSLKPIEEYFADRRALTRADFLKSHAVSVLVMPLNGAPEDQGALRTLMMPIGGAAPTAKPMEKLGVVEIIKRTKDAFQGFIWLGREPNCDVVVPFANVSKLQAQFVPRPGEVGGFDLVDVGSTNGTFVEGQRLARNQPITLVNGKKVVFGTLEVRFLTPVGFYEELGDRIKTP